MPWCSPLNTQCCSEIEVTPAEIASGCATCKKHPESGEEVGKLDPVYAAGAGAAGREEREEKLLVTDSYPSLLQGVGGSGNGILIA